MGQNFISDPYIIDQIVEASGAGPSDTVVEIGPGKGALTVGLSELAKRVIAVELDREVIPLLKGNLAGAPNVTVVNEDILKFDWTPVLEQLEADRKAAGCEAGEAAGKASNPETGNPGVLRIVGNLPYYITTPILLGLLEKKVPAETITVMVQKEVAERIVAPPGGRDYGVLSVSLQYYCDCSYVLDVPAEYFSPRPKVDSAVVNLTLKKQRLFTDSAGEEAFFGTVKAAFSQRRKTLLNSLAGFNGLPKDRIEKILEDCGIDSKRRPETLSLEEFAALSKGLSSEV